MKTDTPEIEKEELEEALLHHKKEVKKELKSLVRNTNDVLLAGGILLFSYWIVSQLTSDRGKKKTNVSSLSKRFDTIFSLLKNTVGTHLVVSVLEMVRDRLSRYIKNNSSNT